MAREAKEINKERKVIDEKLTNAEIDYNKVYYIQKEKKLSIAKLEKEKDRSSEEGILKLEQKLEKSNLLIDKEKSKLERYKKKEFKTRDLKKSNINSAKFKLNKEKQNNKKILKKLNKAKNASFDLIDEKIDALKKQIDSMREGVDSKKEIVSNFKKEYKELKKEWKELFPELDDSIILSVKNLDIFYGEKQSLFDVSMDFPRNKIISIIGPSGCGKSTFLKTLNRINDEIPSFSAKGKILLNNEIDILTNKNIYDQTDKLTLPELRTKIGMVFQQPNPFPMSIYNNVAYGPRINGIKNNAALKEIVVKSLKKVALYEQVKDNLKLIATSLSGGQQQRLCIARAIANSPEILLMDEPTSALDPIAASKVEDLILELKKDYTIIMVTHSMQQASRISDMTAFFYEGKLIEYATTKKIFTRPKEEKTDNYIRGKFG